MVDENGNIFSSKDNVCMALLEDGRMVEYDGCANESDFSYYRSDYGWKFIGRGVIYSVNNGVRQSMEETRYFFVKDKA